MRDFQYLCDIQEVQEDKATIVQIGKDPLESLN